MEAFRKLTATAAPIQIANIDTDQIIPARFLKTPRSTDHGQFLFHDMRRGRDGNLSEDFILNQKEFKASGILVADNNFGCGSSREHAVWALMESGFRAVIAPSFATIFRNNALRNGLLTVALAQHELDELVAWVGADPVANTIQLDLEACTIEFDPEREKKVFSIDPTARDMLLKGLDEIGLTEQSMDLVSRFEEQDQALRPWVYLASD